MKQKHNFIKMLTLLFITIFISSCGKEPANELRGSIESSFSLEFDNVEVRLIENEGIAIVYTSDIPNNTENENALNLLYDYEPGNDPPIEEGASLNLLNNSTLSRFRSLEGNGEDRDPFPPIQSGNLTFDRFGLDEGSTAQGHFQITFITGETLFGNFKAQLIHTNENN